MTTPWPLWLHLKAVIALQPLWPAITTWKLFVGSVVQLSGWLSNEMVQVLNRILAPKVHKSSAMVGVTPIRMRVMRLAREVGRIILRVRSAPGDVFGLICGHDFEICF